MKIIDNKTKTKKTTTKNKDRNLTQVKSAEDGVAKCTSENYTIILPLFQKRSSFLTTD